jgi:hypothetical protein
MRASDNHLSGQQPVAALGGTRFAFMEIANLLDNGRTHKTVELTGLQDLTNGSMQHIQHMFGALIGEHRTPIDYLALLEKYPVHR